MGTNALQCDLECCTYTSSPFQPFSAAIAKATKQECGKQFRYIQKHWYKVFPWLSFCTKKKQGILVLLHVMLSQQRTVV